MKKLLVSVPCVTLAVAAAAQTEPADTLDARNLDEIVVEARNQNTSAKMTVYTPAPRQKNAAADAIALLGMMSIPQLVVDPAARTVRTASGHDVALFIDYVAATPQDLCGMRTADVRRVEYLIYPQDPRFKGAQYVLNFIMQKYEWGGYTKLHADKWFGVNRTEASVYSKFACKKMIFDVYADEIYLTDRHKGYSMTESFDFPDLNGAGPRTIERIVTPLSSLYRNNSNDATLRAVYSTEKVQVSNMLQFNNTSVPHDDSQSALAYNPDGLFPSSCSETRSSARNMTFYYNSETYASLTPVLALNVEAAYRYGRNKTDSYYNDGRLGIVNDANERSHFAKVTPCLVWNPDERNSIMPALHAEYSKNTIDYSGTSPSRQNYDVWGFLTGLRYVHSRDRWSAGTLFTWVFALTDLSGTKVNDNYPNGNVFATWSPDSRNQLEANWSFGKEVPETYQKSPNMLRQDELMWYTGTPSLANFWRNKISLSYTWLPSNRWQLAADGYYYFSSDRVVTRYTPDGPGGTMLRVYVNDGDYRCCVVGLSATAKFFGGKLVLKLRPQYWMRHTTGEYTARSDELTCQAQLTWYFGDFYLWGWYVNPSRYIEEDSGINGRDPSRYMVQLGWSHGTWKASATAYNFLRTSWETSRQTLEGRYYGFDSREFGTQSHMRFQFSLSYTFGYGKKLQRGDEVGGAGSAGSAILK